MKQVITENGIKSKPFWKEFGPCLLVLIALLVCMPVPIYAQIEGDFDDDSDVDIVDLGHFAARWLDPCDDQIWCDGMDIDHSQRVDFLDFARLAINWSPGSPPAADDNFSLVSSNEYPTRLAIGADDKIYVTDFERGSVFVYQNNVTDPNNKDLVGELKGLDKPLGIAVDNSGNIFVGSSGRKSVEVYNSQGVKISTIGRGLIKMPNDLTFDNDGNLYVVDSKNKTVWVFGPNGAVQRSIGKPGNGDGRLKFPAAIAIAYTGGGTGELYVADQGNSLIQVFDLDGHFLRSFGGMVIEHGMFTKWYEWEGYFVRVQSLAFDDAGQLHALDCYMDKVQILDPADGGFLSSYGEYGTGAGQLNLPTDIVIDDMGRTIVTEARNKKVQVIPRTP